MGLLFSTAIALLAAWAVVSLVTSALPRSASRFVLHCGLTLATWLGMESCLSFAWLVLRSNDATPFAEDHGVIVGGLGAGFVLIKTLALLLVAVVAAFATRRQRTKENQLIESTGPRVRLPLLAAFLIVLSVAVLGFVYAAIAEPDGGDDALSIWNLHARFLYYGGMDWERPWTAARIQGTPAAWHLDYPLGLPLIVASGWSAWEETEPWIGWGVAGAFTLGSLLVTVGGVAVGRGINQGLLAGAALLGAVGHIQISARQYADAPLSLYFVAALICLMLGQSLRPGSTRWLVLCGCFTGLATWTKNEGLLFALCLSVVTAWAAFRKRGARGTLRALGALLAGAAPALICLAWFKWNLAPRNDLFVGQSSGDQWSRIADPRRYWQIACSMVSHYFNLGKVVAIAAPVYWIGAGASQEPSTERARSLIGPVLAMMLCGYFAVYVITPRDLTWHLSSSMTRLIAQLWPSFVALIFLASRSVDDAPVSVAPPAPVV